MLGDWQSATNAVGPDTSEMPQAELNRGAWKETGFWDLGFGAKLVSVHKRCFTATLDSDISPFPKCCASKQGREREKERRNLYLFARW